MAKEKKATKKTKKTDYALGDQVLVGKRKGKVIDGTSAGIKLREGEFFLRIGRQDVVMHYDRMKAA